MRFKDKNVLITGAALGIGQAIATEFGREGANVVVVDRDVASGEATAASIAALGTNSWFEAADMTDADSVAAMFDRVMAKAGSLDVAVNNAGIAFGYGPLEETPIDQFDKIIAVNLRGVFLCVQHEMKIMKAQRSGVIINTASQAGHVGEAGLTAYTAAKHGVMGITKCAALELGAFNVRCSAISPGAVETGVFKAYFDETRQDELAAKLATIPSGRVTSPEEVARNVLFLASEDARQLTGHTIHLDGGIVGVR